MFFICVHRCDVGQECEPFMPYDHHLEMSQPSRAASMSHLCPLNGRLACLSDKWARIPVVSTNCTNHSCYSFYSCYSCDPKVWPLWRTWWSTCSSRPAWQSQNSLWRAWSGQTLRISHWPRALDIAGRRVGHGWTLSPSVLKCATLVRKQNDSKIHAQFAQCVFSVLSLSWQKPIDMKWLSCLLYQSFLFWHSMDTQVFSATDSDGSSKRSQNKLLWIILDHCLDLLD